MRVRACACVRTCVCACAYFALYFILDLVFCILLCCEVHASRWGSLASTRVVIPPANRAKRNCEKRKDRIGEALPCNLSPPSARIPHCHPHTLQYPPTLYHPSLPLSFSPLMYIALGASLAPCLFCLLLCLFCVCWCCQDGDENQMTESGNG